VAFSKKKDTYSGGNIFHYLLGGREFNPTKHTEVLNYDFDEKNIPSICPALAASLQQGDTYFSKYFRGKIHAYLWILRTWPYTKVASTELGRATSRYAIAK
jgi:hypothetical protein